MAGSGDMGQRDLLEREGEFELIEGLVERTSAGAGGVLFIEGPAGVGKTALLEMAGGKGVAAGFTVLRGRASELDREFPFGVIRRLFERTVSTRPDLLSGGAESAAPVFAPTGASPDDVSFAPLHGLYWLVSNLAADAPLMIVADDLQWCDRASLRSLVFTAERLDDMPVVIVATARSGEPGAEQELLDDLASTIESTVLRPEPLSAPAALSLVRSRLPSADESFGLACHRATGGNPFLLGELLIELGEREIVGSEEDAAGVIDFGSDRVGRAIRRRLRMLPDEATRVARALAVLGSDASISEIQALAELDPSTAARAIDSLAEVHVLRAGIEPEFVHPVVRSAVYDQIPGSDLVAMHSDAARHLAEQDAEVERIAQHLLRVPSQGKPARVALLRAAASEASARGAQAAASNYLERALLESPDGPERGAIHHALGRAKAADGQRDAFGAHFVEALELTDDPGQKARIAIDFGWARGSSGDFGGAAEVLSSGYRRLSSDGRDLPQPFEALMLHFSFLAFVSDAGEVLDRRRAELLDLAGDSPGTDMRAAVALWLSATRPPAANAIRICEDLLDEKDPADLNPILVGAIGNALTYLGELHTAARLYDGTIATAARRGDEMTVIWQSVMKSDISLRLGSVRQAEAEARAALELFVHDFEIDGLAWTQAHLVNSLVARGAIDEAAQLLDEHPMGPEVKPSFGVALLFVARANLRLAVGSSTAALRDATAAGEMAAIITNPACCEWRSPAALALANLDRREEALEMAQGQLEDARSFGIPDAVGPALRTLGMVLPGGEGIDELRASVEVLEEAEARLEHARSLLELGAGLRRVGERKEAAAVLREALDLTAGCGASGLADRAHAELVAAGARPRRDRRMLSGPESLTASEERVAALAAEGLTNREIAQRQFVTVKAVEWHLRNVFRKLDITSREQLPEALS